MSWTPHSDVIGRVIYQDPSNGEIGPDAGRGASCLGRGSSQGRPRSPFDSWEKRGYLFTNWATSQDKPSLYGGRQRSNFTV